MKQNPTPVEHNKNSPSFASVEQGAASTSTSTLILQNKNQSPQFNKNLFQSQLICTLMEILKKTSAGPKNNDFTIMEIKSQLRNFNGAFEVGPSHSHSKVSPQNAYSFINIIQ